MGAGILQIPKRVRKAPHPQEKKREEKMKKRTPLFPHSHSIPENGCTNKGAFSILRATLGGPMPVVLAKGKQMTSTNSTRRGWRRPITYQKPISQDKWFNKTQPHGQDGGAKMADSPNLLTKNEQHTSNSHIHIFYNLNHTSKSKED